MIREILKFIVERILDFLACVGFVSVASVIVCSVVVVFMYIGLKFFIIYSGLVALVLIGYALSSPKLSSYTQRVL